MINFSFQNRFQVIARVFERAFTSFYAEHRLSVKLRSTNLRRNEIPRNDEAHPSGPGCQKHSRLFEKYRQSLRLWVVQGPRGRKGLLPDQFQCKFEAAHCLVRKIYIVLNYELKTFKSETLA